MSNVLLEEAGRLARSALGDYIELLEAETRAKMVESKDREQASDELLAKRVGDAKDVEELSILIEKARTAKRSTFSIHALIHGSFQTAHALNNYPGKCTRIHGHDYSVRWKVHFRKDKKRSVLEMPVSEGVIEDFKNLRAVLKTVLDPLDHVLLVSPFDRRIPKLVELGTNLGTLGVLPLQVGEMLETHEIYNQEFVEAYRKVLGFDRWITNPTAENLVLLLVRRLNQALARRKEASLHVLARTCVLSLNETPDCSVEWAAGRCLG